MGIENIDEYKSAIRTLADIGENYRFSNSRAEKATVVMANIFRTSNSELKIFAENLRGEVSQGDYLVELKKFLQKGGEKKIEILLESKPDINNLSEALSLLKEFSTSHKNKKNISIKIVDSKVVSGVFKNDTINHFTIGDGKMFRFETDTKKFTAFCNFYDPKTCIELTKMFEAISIGASEFTFN